MIRPPEEGVEAMEEQEFFPAAGLGGGDRRSRRRHTHGGPTEASTGAKRGQSGARSGSRSRRSSRTRSALLGLGLFVLLVLFCFVGPHIYVTNQHTVNPAFSNLPPSSAHPLGTDGEGFDVLGRLMIAGQSSIEIGLAAGLVCGDIRDALWSGLRPLPEGRSTR